jgi:hypothetical protein
MDVFSFLVIRLLASSNYNIDNGGLPSRIQKIIARNFGEVSYGQPFRTPPFVCIHENN